jgi:PAS domain S-box-containing protein
VLPELSPERLEELAVAPEHLELMRRLRYRSALVLPLTARGRTFGVLSFLRLGDRVEPFDDDDLAMGRDLARRAALALDNARLFGELRSTEGRLEAIVGNLGEAVSAFTPDGRQVFANQAAAELSGASSPDELLTTPVGEIVARFTILDEAGAEVRFEDLPIGRALRGEHAEPTLLRAIDRTGGADRWLLSRVEPVRDDAGEVQLIVAVTEDVTAVKRQEARQRLLASASKLLISSLDVDSTLEKAAWAAVPELADYARVDLPDERGDLREAAVAHRDVHKTELLREWRRKYPPSPDSDDGPWEVLRTGRSIVWDEVRPEDMTSYAHDERHLELLRELDTRSMLIVPMKIGDAVVGTLELATTGESGRRLGGGDLELAEELARRAAIAVENSRVHAARTHVATTLQRSLLPPRLPVVPGLTIAARFRAAGAATDVGGDFYDLFQSRDGWMVVMGDVTGKGPGAAAITSLARYTMRTAAMYESAPRAVLERLNATLAVDADRRQICTAVCVGVRHEPAGVALEVACAGHPPPLLLAADGSVRPVGAPGTLLGAFPEGRWTATEVVLGPGDALVLYTDGVTDTQGAEGRFGHERLTQLLESVGPQEPDTIASHIDDALRAFGEQRDDVALLVLRADPAEAGESTIVASGEAA